MNRRLHQSRGTVEKIKQSARLQPFFPDSQNSHLDLLIPRWGPTCRVSADSTRALAKQRTAAQSRL